MEEEREIRCGGKYEKGVKEFLGCARAQRDSERAQMGGKKRKGKSGRSGGSQRSQRGNKGARGISRRRSSSGDGLKE